MLFSTVLPSILPYSSMNIISKERDNESTNQKLVQNLNVEPIQENSIDLKLKEFTQDTDSEAYFPNFLFYSIEIANLLIQNLYDNDSDGFFFSSNEEWEKTAINTEKRTYDNAQAILALVKLAEAVISQTEREFALNIAENTRVSWSYNAINCTDVDGDTITYGVNDSRITVNTATGVLNVWLTQKLDR